jgi:hypothetical protein
MEGVAFGCGSNLYKGVNMKHTINHDENKKEENLYQDQVANFENEGNFLNNSKESNDIENENSAAKVIRKTKKRKYNPRMIFDNEGPTGS